MSERDTISQRPQAPDQGPELTGDAAVDAALVDLAALDPELEPAEQLPVLTAVHEALQQRLSSTEG